MNTFLCASLDFLDANVIEVESSFTKGMPSFSIVGLVSTSISESKDRVKSALLTNEYKFPPLKITVNLAPSEIKKKGTHFDLSIALHLALYDKKIKNVNNYFIFGELGLDGLIKHTSETFPIILSLARQKKITKVLLCEESAKFVSKIDFLELYVVNTLNEAIEFFSSKEKDKFLYEKQDLDATFLLINEKKYFYIKKYEEDFSEVIGQELAKEAAMICAAGGHNLLMEGSAGCGKSMIAKRIQYIMPPLSLEELLENIKLQSLDYSKINFLPLRNFRSPHHSSTKSSIFGGGSLSAKIGEIALANNGILFFDELPHFSKSILEALREPLEDYKILISRVNSKTLYETKFNFIAAMNPCPCGNLLSSRKECRCSEAEIARYKNKISEPLHDRIDLYVQMTESSKDNKSIVSSRKLHDKVLNAFIKQKNRGQKELNGKLPDKYIKKYCPLSKEAEELFSKICQKFDFSHRSVNKFLKLSRTIADLNENEIIQKEDIYKSLSFKKRK